MPHSKISPSKSSRWINCPGSLLLEEKCPKPEQSVYAAEGQAAHEVAGECLKLNQDASEWVGETIETSVKNFKVTEYMADNVQIYLDTVREDMTKDNILPEFLAVEKKVKLPMIDKDLYGTLDASYPDPFGVLRIYDLKYGRGTYVEVEDNTQLLTYLLGAYYEYEKLYEEMEIVIVQPRYKEEGVDPVRRQRITAKELLAFEKKLREACARVRKKDDTLKLGEHCKWCPAMAICPLQMGDIFDKMPVKTDQKEAVLQAIELPDPGALSVPQIVNILSITDQLNSYAAAVYKHAESLAKTGVKIPGHKLIRKLGNRAWVDEIAVETEFENEFGEMLYDKKLKSPAKLEKVVGKDRVKNYIERPDRGLALVSDSARGEPVEVNPGAGFKKLPKEKKGDKNG